ncbi:sulfotransferase domain-containing protein [Candidatus Bipolaricaulota bacterium]|nr:sulfotransferase domain-containing protein [Candidatus Bipolaricaulota bacterium]
MTNPIALKKSVIVAGHPRSGTSLVCQLVESAGVHFPSDFEGDKYNQGGYYEMSLGKEVSKLLMKEAMTKENTEKMNKVVRRLNQERGWSGLKLVRVPALFFYRHIAEEIKMIGVFRNPANVKASLFKRGIAEFPVSWTKNANALIAAYENIDQSILLSYESLVEGASHVPRGFEKIGLDADTSIIDSDQQTQKNSRVLISSDEEKLYERLKKLERESCSKAGSRWHKLRG